MSKDWIIRKYKDGDENQIFKLVNDFGDWGMNDDIALKAWNWKYKKNYIRDANVLVAEDNSKIIGFYTILPIRILILGNYVLCGRAEEGLTDPNYRKQGIFQSLLDKGIKISKQEGIDNIYGNPNEPSLRVHSKLGWETLCHNTLLVNILNTSKINTDKSTIYKLKRKVKMFLFSIKRTTRNQILSIENSNIKITNVSKFDERINELWDRNTEEYDFIIERKMDYLNWRYTLDPVFDNKIFIAEENDKILGYIVIGKYKEEALSDNKNDLNFGYILDIFCDQKNTNIISLLVFKAIDYFKNNNIDGIRCRMLKDTIYYKILSKYGFSNWSEKAFIIRSTDERSIQYKEKINDKNRMHITFGDGF